MLVIVTDLLLDRLARFDGRDFHPVGAGSVDAEVVHVFAHGWQPGYRVTERLLATTDGVSALPAWDPRLVDPRGRPLIADYLPLLEALTALGPGHAVLCYSWLDESATDADIVQAFRSRRATQVNGRRLAAAVQLAVPPPGSTTGPPTGSPGSWPRPRVHLIGHSHGSAVVTHAAVSMTRPPAHLTLLDAPEDPISRLGGASDLIDLVLPRLRPGRARGTPFVDSYASAFGRPYHRRPGLEAVVDVLLGVPLVLSRDPIVAINAAHLYPVDWYARSVRAVAGLEPGRHRRHAAAVGYGWSPLTGDDPTRLLSWYHAPLPQRPLVLRRHLGEPLARGTRRLLTRLGRAVPVRRRPVDPRLEVTGKAPVAATVVRAQPGEQLIEFDLELRGTSGSETIELDLDGVPAFLALAAHPVPGSGRYLMLADGPPGEHLVTMRLSGAAGTARARMVNLRLVTLSPVVRSFTVTRTASTVFAAGAISGGVLTAVAGAGLASLVRRWPWRWPWRAGSQPRAR